MRFTEIVQVLVVSLAFLSAGCRTAAPAATTGVPAPVSPDVIIEHVGGSQILAGTIHKQRGERVRVEVRKTETLCYSFNFRVKTDEVGQPASNAIDFNDTVAFETMFWGDPLLLEIEAIRLPGTTDADCGQGGERKTGGALPPWQVRVTTDGWDIFFSGAFTADKLTDPVFALVSEDRDLDLTDTDTTKTKGFVVRQSEEDDEFRLAAAAMTHVLHSNPDRFNFGDINWVPLSFGLGISDNSQARYYLGTGIRFGQKFFLTAGAAVGPVKRLPATLSLDANDKRNFTTDANALSSLQTRNESAFFVGISYSFAGVGPSNFSGPFTPVKPAPSGATQAPAPAPAAPVTPPTTTTPPITPVTPTPTPVTANSVTLTTTDAAPTGRNAMYNIVVEVPTGGSSTPVEIAHTFYDAAALAAAPTVVCTVTGPGGPAHPCPQPPITFPLKITIDPGTKYTLSTLMTFNSDTHAEKDLPVTLKHGTPAVTITKSVKVK